jgi:hypothetical protein
MANLANIIPAFMIGPNGQRLTPEQIRERQQIAQSLMAQASDTSPNAGGVASILAKGVQGFAAGRARNQADSASGANSAASQSNLQKMFASLTGGGSVSPVSQGAAASPMVAPVQGVASATNWDASAIDPTLKTGIQETASALGIDPVDLATAISYETGGTFDPTKAGPTTQWGQHKGLIQFGEPQAQKYGVNWEDPIGSQLGPNGAVANYLRDTGVQPGMGLMDIYSAINAGGVGRNNRTDANNGGAPGTVADKVNQQMGGHRAKALALFGGGQAAPAGSAPIQQAPMQTAQAAPAINPAVIEALSSPYASEQERSVAGLLLNQSMSQQQAAQAKALKQQERQQELARRQQIAQQAGINPQYAMDDELWKGATGNVFAAPSTSTVNGAVIDNRTGQPIYQAPAQNYRQITGPDAAALGLDPAKAYNVGPDGKVAPIGDAGVTITNNMGGDKFGEEFAKLDAKALDTVATSGQAAQRNLGRINQLGELLKSSPTGFEGAVAQRAGEWGIPTKGLDTLQAAQAAINSLVPEQRQPGSGPMSDADLALFKQSLPRIINQPGGNDLIINTMKSIAQYDAEGANIVQQLRSGKLDRAKAFEALQNRVNPLDSFKVPGAPAENPMPSQQTATGWKDLGNGVKIRPKGSN